jgi:hypothetical protein
MINKIAVIGLLMLFLNRMLYGQSKVGIKGLNIGSGGLLSGYQNDTGKPIFDFFLLNSYLSINLTKKYEIGYRNLMIYEKPESEGFTRFKMHGLFIKNALLHRKDLRMGIEAGYYIGNYCSCQQLLRSVERPNTKVLILGTFSEVKLWKYFFLEVSSRYGLYIPRIAGVKLGNFGILLHAGLAYRLPLVSEN